jgi:hypothetical protein
LAAFFIEAIAATKAKGPLQKTKWGWDRICVRATICPTEPYVFSGRVGILSGSDRAAEILGSNPSRVQAQISALVMQLTGFS